MREGRDTWIGKSKLVDDCGAPMVFFHGSPDASFERFWGDQFFTSDRGYASRFLSSSTPSSSYYGVTDQRPGVFAVHIRAEKPFDTRDPKHLGLLRSGFCGVFGEGALTDAGLPDWVEARDIAEWLRAELPDHGFDAIIVDEGRDDAGQRPASYVIFSGDQVRILEVLHPEPPYPDLADSPGP